MYSTLQNGLYIEEPAMRYVLSLCTLLMIAPQTAWSNSDPLEKKIDLMNEKPEFIPQAMWLDCMREKIDYTRAHRTSVILPGPILIIACGYFLFDIEYSLDRFEMMEIPEEIIRFEIYDSP